MTFWRHAVYGGRGCSPSLLWRGENCRTAMPPLAGFSTLVPSIHGLLEKSTHLASLSSWLFTGVLYENNALVFHRNARGICPTNQVSVVHRGSTSIWSPIMSTAAPLLREAVCLKTKDLQVAGLQAVSRPLYL